LALTSKKVTPLFLKNRYKQYKEENGMSKGPLTEQDDINIVKAIEKWGLKNGWEKLYEAVPAANKIQVRNRYYTKLRNKAYYAEILEKIREE